MRPLLPADFSSAVQPSVMFIESKIVVPVSTHTVPASSGLLSASKAYGTAIVSVFSGHTKPSAADADAAGNNTAPRAPATTMELRLILVDFLIRNSCKRGRRAVPRRG